MSKNAKTALATIAYNNPIVVVRAPIASSPIKASVKTQLTDMLDDYDTMRPSCVDGMNSMGFKTKIGYGGTYAAAATKLLAEMG